MSNDSEGDVVNHPPHYNMHPSGVECIDITEWYNFNVGNAIKYLWRSDHKNGVEDLEKARWYIDREILRIQHPLQHARARREVHDVLRTYSADPDAAPD